MTKHMVRLHVYVPRSVSWRSPIDSNPKYISIYPMKYPIVYPKHLPLYQWEFQDPELEVPTIYKAYVREYPQKMWPYMVQYLQFRILEFPLIIMQCFFVTTGLTHERSQLRSIHLSAISRDFFPDFFGAWPWTKNGAVIKNINRKSRYSLVNCYITMERSTIFHGKTHYFYGHVQ